MFNSKDRKPGSKKDEVPMEMPGKDRGVGEIPVEDDPVEQPVPEEVRGVEISRE